MSGGFRLGSWVVQPSLNSIECNGKTTRLEPKMVEVLVYLAEHPGEAVSKEQLIQAVWADTFVTDDVLTRCISELRRALEDDPKEPKFIETIPKRGYRLVGEIKPLTTRRRNWRVASVLLTVASLMILAVWLSRNLLKAPAGSLSISRLTTSGKVPLAAISPDGKYLTYSEDDGDRQSLWLQQMASGSRSVLLPPAAAKYSTVRFSPDSNYVYYTRGEGNGRSTLYQIPAIGGAPRKLLADVPNPVAVSADGKSFAFVRRKGEDSALVVKAADGSGERTIATRQGSVWFGDPVAWSPDEKRLAAVEFSTTSVFSAYLVVVPADGGRETRITHEGLMRIFRLEWLPDGSGLIAPVMGTHYQLWEFPYPNGHARRITHDPLRYDEVSLTPIPGIW